MGTRGFLGVVIDGHEKITYNHFDSYPSGLGADVLTWAQTITDWDKVREQARMLTLVDEDSKPTPDEQEKLVIHANTDVSTGATDEWYVLLRDLQGSMGGYLETGYMIDSGLFPLDSLFAEYGYIVDLDAGTFEVYKGFQHESPKSGRWAGRPTAEESAKNFEAHQKWCTENGREPWETPEPEYHAVELWAVWSIYDLPTSEQFHSTLEQDA